MIQAFIWYAGRLKRSFLEGVPYLVSGPYLLCSSEAIFTIRQLDHGSGSSILRQKESTPGK